MNLHRSVFLCCFNSCCKEEKSSAGLLPSGFTRRSCAGSQSSFLDPGSDPSGQLEGHTKVGYCEVRLAKTTPWTAVGTSTVLELLSDVLEDLKSRCPASYFQREIARPAGDASKLVLATLTRCALIAQSHTPKIVRELGLDAVGQVVRESSS